MPDDQLTIEGLRRWSQALLWVSVILPLLGGLAAGARYYIERREKQISSRITSTSIQNARDEALAARKELGEFKEQSAPRRLTDSQHSQILGASTQLKGLSIVVVCRMMDGESCDFASDVATALRAAGSSVPDLVRTSLNDLPGYVAVSFPGSSIAPQANAVIAALVAAGIDTRLESVDQRSLGVQYPGFIHVIVGRKRS